MGEELKLSAVLLLIILVGAMSFHLLSINKDKLKPQIEQCQIKE